MRHPLVGSAVYNASRCGAGMVPCIGRLNHSDDDELLRRMMIDLLRVIADLG